jgi:hypothetical protein
VIDCQLVLQRAPPGGIEQRISDIRAICASRGTISTVTYWGNSFIRGVLEQHPFGIERQNPAEAPGTGGKGMTAVLIAGYAA